MAIIVKMPASRARASREPQAGNGAQILFFTGVRYCRDVDPEPEQEASVTPPSTATPPVTRDSAMLAYV